MTQKLRITAKGKEVIKICKQVGHYSFDSIEKLRLYEVGVLNCPTGDRYTDRYIESLLKAGFLEVVPEVPEKATIKIDWQRMNQ